MKLNRYHFSAFSIITLFILMLAFTAGLVAFFLKTVDLKPHVDEKFFFSSDDPQFREDRMISKLFPQPPQLVIGARGDFHSEEYLEKLRRLTAEIDELTEVFSVQSLTQGPSGVQDAIESPLWRRMLLATDGEASFINVFIKDVPAEEIVPKVERITAKYHQPGFEIMISGAPYITELIRRNLEIDLKRFSAAAFIVFGILLFFVFRSFFILLGTLASCVNASMLTLLITQFLDIKVGPLTANLSTIVFVLTLTHIVFMTFNWKSILEKGSVESRKGSSVIKAILMTLNGSFWSMFTTLLGFISLLFVQATPLKQLGISGSFGTLCAFACAYLIYPCFLQVETLRKKAETRNIFDMINFQHFFKRPHTVIVICLLLVAFVGGFGMDDVNTDPSLFSYFKKGGELRSDLEYIDQNGGSSPLQIVVTDEQLKKFGNSQVFVRLARLHKALEEHPSVGSVVSLPLVLAEARRVPMTGFLSTETLIKILASPNYGEIAQYFITEDREKSLLVVRMKESGRTQSRPVIIDQIKNIIRAEKLTPVLVGGVYALQGKLAALLTSSLFSGLTLLISLFILIGFFLSRSFKVTFSLFVSLCAIPITMLGILGLAKIPLDIISAPAANIAISMGVDAMIHMIVMARRGRKKINDWGAWEETCMIMWKPILASMMVVTAGFSIFGLSTFPPTERFGYSVVLGSTVAPLTAIFLLPWLSSFQIGRRHHRQLNRQ